MLAQIKGGNNSYRLKNKIRQILYLSHQYNKITKKSWQQFNQVIAIMGDNKLVITTESKRFHFDLSKDAGINLKHEIYSIINHNEHLAEHTIKNEIRQLLSNYKHGIIIHEHCKE